jgi:hypothetical protein
VLYTCGFLMIGVDPCFGLAIGARDSAKITYRRLLHPSASSAPSGSFGTPFIRAGRSLDRDVQIHRCDSGVQRQPNSPLTSRPRLRLGKRFQNRSVRSRDVQVVGYHRWHAALASQWRDGFQGWSILVVPMRGGFQTRKVKTEAQ